MSEWQPVDTIPMDGTPVLALLWEDQLEPMVIRYEPGVTPYPWTTLDSVAYHEDAPAWWMPIPEAPGRKP